MNTLRRGPPEKSLNTSPHPCMLRAYHWGALPTWPSNLWRSPVAGVCFATWSLLPERKHSTPNKESRERSYPQTPALCTSRYPAKVPNIHPPSPGNQLQRDHSHINQQNSQWILVRVQYMFSHRNQSTKSKSPGVAPPSRNHPSFFEIPRTASRNRETHSALKVHYPALHWRFALKAFQ